MLLLGEPVADGGVCQDGREGIVGEPEVVELILGFPDFEHLLSLLRGVPHAEHLLRGGANHQRIRGEEADLVFASPGPRRRGDGHRPRPRTTHAAREDGGDGVGGGWVVDGFRGRSSFPAFGSPDGQRRDVKIVVVVILLLLLGFLRVRIVLVTVVILFPPRVNVLAVGHVNVRVVERGGGGGRRGSLSRLEGFANLGALAVAAEPLALRRYLAQPEAKRVRTRRAPAAS